MNLANWGVPKFLKFFFDENADTLSIPIGAFFKLIEKNILPSKLLNITDNRTIASDANVFSKLKFEGVLRGYQKELVDVCLANEIGIIEAGTGTGKTASFINLIVERQINTLILVNTVELAHQTRDALVKFTNLKKEDVGFIGSGTFDVKPISIGIHQTVAKLSESSLKILNTTFGQIIADEVHICGATTYFANLNKLNAKYKIGFSATVQREDGLTAVVHFATGEKIYTVSEEDTKKYLIHPSIKYIYTEYFYPLLSSSEYQDVLTDMASNKQRNQLILDTFKEYENRYCVFLCHRVEHTKILQNMIGDSAVVLTSDLKKKERLKIMQELNNKTKKHVISTYGLFSTGIDIPHLDVLFFCAPIKSKTKIIQSVGRIRRKAEGKTAAFVIDFADVKVELLKTQFYKRRSILNKL
jgi:superfamily II DNA or RNA helicase